MKRLIAFSILSLSAQWSFATQLMPAEIYSRSAPSVVVIYGLDSEGLRIKQGSGVVISPSVVVSNCHVLESTKGVRVVHQGDEFHATLRNGDLARDVCALDVPSLAAPRVTLGESAGHRVGASVYAIGAPLGLDLSISDGLLSGYRSVPFGSMLQITAPISPGSSGGGLFDSQGKLIGITTSTIQRGQQINFAVPVEWAVEVAGKPPLIPSKSKKFVGEPVPSAKRAPMRVGSVVEGRWVLVYEDDEYSMLFDLETMERSGKSRVVWQRKMYRSPQVHGEFDNVSEVRVRWRYNCQSGEGELGAYQIYSAGSIVSEVTTTEFPESTVLPPGSLGEKLMQDICSAE